MASIMIISDSPKNKLSLKRKRDPLQRFSKQNYSGRNKSSGRFSKGNQVWKKRTKCGRTAKFSSAEQLLHVCEEYFDWVEVHPFFMYKEVGLYRGEPIIAEIPQKRPMTIRGLCLFLGISQVTWWNYKKRSPDFFNICSRVEQVIWVQKFEGAVLGFFKPAIIARELSVRHRKGL